jgi:hypothetical protein
VGVCEGGGGGGEGGLTWKMARARLKSAILCLGRLGFSCVTTIRACTICTINLPLRREQASASGAAALDQDGLLEIDSFSSFVRVYSKFYSRVFSPI